MKYSEHYLFASFLIDAHNIDTDIILEALEIQKKQIIPIGRLAMDLRYMSVRQVMDTLFTQGDSKKLFGEIAVELGFMTSEDLSKLLHSQENELIGLGDILIKMNIIDAHQYDIFLSEFTQQQT